MPAPEAPRAPPPEGADWPRFVRAGVPLARGKICHRARQRGGCRAAPPAPALSVAPAALPVRASRRARPAPAAAAGGAAWGERNRVSPRAGPAAAEEVRPRLRSAGSGPSGASLLRGDPAAAAPRAAKQRRRVRTAPGPAPPARRMSREEAGTGAVVAGPTGSPGCEAAPRRGGDGAAARRPLFAGAPLGCQSPAPAPCGAGPRSTAELPPPTAFPEPGAVPVPTPFWSFSLVLTLQRAQLLSGGIGRLVVTSLVETKITKVVGCIWKAD